LSVSENPSDQLARTWGLPSRILEVSFSGIDQFLSDLQSQPAGALLMLGVSRRARTLRQEMFARNLIGPTPDVLGVCRAGVMDGPPVMGSTLFDRAPKFPGVRVSFDAGDYLCKYAYYQALLLLPSWKVGFLHVPPFERVTAEFQKATLAKLLAD
jgi:hypothetical protein